jgi:hypothetical protein
VRPPQSITPAFSSLIGLAEFVPTAQFPGLRVEHLEILEMGDRHGRDSDRSRVDRALTEMSYADSPASMGKPCAHPESVVPWTMWLSGESDD